jgi:hypothetical protein
MASSAITPAQQLIVLLGPRATQLVGATLRDPLLEPVDVLPALGGVIEPDRKAEEVARLTRLGAELLETHDDCGPLTYVMRDPEGNEFCLH